MNFMDKRARAALFRQRLSTAMEAEGVNRSDLARAVGADRTTVGQLLSEGAVRLPNAGLAADAAGALGVSADWLLGLTEWPEPPGELLASAIAMTAAERASTDAQLAQWREEAAGYKVRHVPAVLPDMLKTEAFLRWEYAAFLGRTPDEAVAVMQGNLDSLKAGASDYEIAAPLHEVQALAAGAGYYAGLDAGVRRAQLQQFADLARDLYPTLRLFLYDAHTSFSAPVTIFGPMLAVIYVGRMYLAFRERERVRTLAQHFDWLVREAVVTDRDAADYLDGMARSTA